MKDNNKTVEFGAEVSDQNGQVLGKIDYIMRDAYTGEIRKFKVNVPDSQADLFFSLQDITEVSPGKVKVNTSPK